MICKILYKKKTLMGYKEKMVIARGKAAFKIIDKCHRRNYPIIIIEHV